MFVRSGDSILARLVLVAVLALVAGSPAVPDGGPPAPQAAAGVDDATLERLRALHYREEEQVRLVLLPAVVTDRRNRPIRGLEAKDFRVSEDYVPQQIRYFGAEHDLPVSVAFLLDVSGSMRQVGKLDEAKEAIRVFLDALNPGDRFGLICFADDQVAWVTDFTSDRTRFQRRLAVQEAFGQTALFDALAATPRLVDASVTGRKAIVLITDGIDNASQLSLFDAVRLARGVNVPIYSVALASFASSLRPGGSLQDTHRVVQRFSEETGGALFTVHDPDDLKEAVIEIQEELRFQYVVGYRPSRKLWDGGFRRVRLETAKDGLHVRTRAGYYANP